MSTLPRQLLEDPSVQRLLVDLHQSSMKAAEEKAKADPLAHRLSRVFPAGVSPRYRYYDAGRDGRNRRILFAWTTVTNVAGFYLGWREVLGKSFSKRDRWVARRLRRRVKEIALARYGSFKGHRVKLAELAEGEREFPRSLERS